MAVKTIEIGPNRVIEAVPLNIIHMQEAFSQYTASDGTEIQVRVPLRRAYKVVKLIVDGVEQELKENEISTWVEMDSPIITADKA